MTQRVGRTDYGILRLEAAKPLNMRDDDFLLPQGTLIKCENMEPYPDGHIERVSGTTEKLAVSTGYSVRNLFTFFDENQSETVYFTTNDELHELGSDLTSSSEIVDSSGNSAWDGETADQKVDFVDFAGTVYMGNGNSNCLKVSHVDNTVYKWSITAPASAPSLSQSASGGNLGDGDYRVLYTYYNTDLGVESMGSSDESITLNGGGSNQKITVTVTASSDVQVDKIRLYRTRVSGSIFYYFKEVANTSGDYYLTQADSDAGTQYYTDGYYPPPKSNIMTMFNNRIYMVDADDPTKVKYSENGALGRVYLESFKVSSYFKFPTAVIGLAKTPHGMLVLQNSAAVMLAGDNPSQFTWVELSQTIGCSNSKSISHNEQNPVWVDNYGAYIYNGSDIVPFGDIIEDVFTNYDMAQADGMIHRRENKYYVLGKDSSYNDVMLIYDFRINSWHIRTSQDLRSLAWKSSIKQMLGGGRSKSSIFLLDDISQSEPATYDGTSIDGRAQWAYSSFDALGDKYLRSLISIIKARGDFTLIVRTEDNSSGTSYTITPDNTSYTIHRHERYLGVQSDVAMYYSFELQNNSNSIYTQLWVGDLAIRVKERALA